MTDRHTLRADRRRAQACLQACEGIPTEALEAGVVERMRDTLAEGIGLATGNLVGMTFLLAIGQWGRTARKLIAELNQ